MIIFTGLAPTTLMLIILGMLIIGIVSGFPVAFVLGGVATIFFLLFFGFDTMLNSYYRVWRYMNLFPMAAVPLFIFMGAIMERAGIADSLFDAVYSWFGGIRGGLAVGTIFICAIFAACTGIVGAATVSMGYIALPAMLKRRYKKDLPLGAVMGGGTLGPLIPPSLPFIFFGLFGMTSIGGLFMAGVGSGLLVALIMVVIILVRCYFVDPELGPAAPPDARATWREKLISLRGVILPLILVITVLGSIFSGAASPTEAAAVGAFGALVCGLIYRKLTWTIFRESVWRGFRSAVMIIWIGFGAYAFAAAFSLSGGLAIATEGLAAMGPWPAIAAIQIVTLILGMFMPLGALGMILAPLLFPLMDILGFDRFWFGAIWNMATLVGYMSPPFGYSLFYMKAIIPDIDPTITTRDLYKSVIPYMAAHLIGIVIICLYPPIATWLPQKMFELKKATAGVLG